MRSKPLLVIFFTVFLDLLGFGIIIPILPYYAERFGASPALITLLMASYSLMQFLFAPVWGRLSDRLGRRPIILLSLAVSTGGYVLLGLASSLTLVFVARILAGIGNANIPTAQAYVADVTKPEERARGMGLVGMAFGLGFVFGPALGGLLGGIAMHLPAFAAAALTALDLLLAIIILREPRERGLSQAGQRGLGANVRAFIVAIERPNMAILFALFFLATFAFAQLESTFSLYIEHRFTLHQSVLGPPAPVAISTPHDGDTQRAAARATGGALFVVGIVSAIVQGGLIGRLARRFGEEPLVKTGLLLLALGLAIFPLAPTIALLYPACVVIAAGSGILGPSLQSLLSRNAPADEQGGTLGLGQSLASLARVLGPVLGGNLFEHVGLGAPYWIGGLLMLGAATLTLRLRPAPGVPGSGRGMLHA
jgi:MFS family permease